MKRWERAYLNGNFGEIDGSKNILSRSNNDGQSYSDWYSIRVQSFDDYIGSATNDWIHVTNDNVFSADLGAGDDIIEVNRFGKVSITFDGGDGDDTLRLSNGGLFDLTGSTLVDVEGIYHAESRLIVTETQFANWSFDGNGAIYTLGSDGVVQGSSANDSYSGDGVSGGFAGGKGDDYISNIKTAVYNSNLNEYDITRNGDTVTVQHARGDMSDGTDTLNNVLQLEFADTTPSNPYILDDAPSEGGLWNLPYAFVGQKNVLDF